VGSVRIDNITAVYSGDTITPFDIARNSGEQSTKQMLYTP